MTITRFDPFREFAILPRGSWVPPVDIFETATHDLVIKAELPEVKKEDVKVTVSDPNGEVLVHLGSSDYLNRFKIYVAHVQEWRQQFQKVRSVDLRYDRQVVVNPDDNNPTQPKSLTKARARVKR